MRNPTHAPLVYMLVVFGFILLISFILVSLRHNPSLAQKTPTSNFYAFGAVTLPVTFSLNGAGTTIDSLAFWEAPSPQDSLLFVSSKGIALVEVWKYPFIAASDQLPAIRHSCINAGSNGVVVDQETDLLYVSVRSSTNVCVFALPSMTYQQTITSGVIYHTEPNVALLKLTSGEKRLYVSDDTVVYIHNATTGQKLSQFTPTRGLETMWGDSHDRVLYIPDENRRTGVYAYNPDGSAYTRNGASKFGDSSVFSADTEGIIEYTCPSNGRTDDGSGLIIVSDQINDSTIGNDYEVFDRRTWRYLGKIKLIRSGTYIYNTDGIASTQQASPQYPQGVFTAVDHDMYTVGLGWDAIFSAISVQGGMPFGCATNTYIPYLISNQ